jgi:hypothetical protein
MMNTIYMIKAQLCGMKNSFFFVLIVHNIPLMALARQYLGLFN